MHTLELLEGVIRCAGSVRDNYVVNPDCCHVHDCARAVIHDKRAWYKNAGIHEKTSHAYERA
jgi:hypothetical protein